MSQFRSHICNFYELKQSAIQYMTYKNESSELAIAREDNSIEIWKVTDKVCYQIKKIAANEDASIEAIVWCRGRLLSAGLTGEMSLYDLSKLTVSKSITVSSSAIWCMKPNHDESAVALGTEDGSIYIYTMDKSDDTDNMNIAFSKIIGHDNQRIICLAWSKNSRYIVVGSLGMAKVWDYESGSVRARLNFPGTKKGETVVWCVEFVGSKTIVCGDSSGTVSFWDAEHGTLLQEHKRHRADVLCLCVSESTKKVYCAGIDPFINIYERVPTGSDRKSWVFSNHRNLHTHDVRAICVTPHYLLSGGMDCNLLLSKYPPKTRITIPHIAHDCVYVPLNSSNILLKYTSRLELWRLGVADPASNLEEHAEKQIVLQQAPRKLLEIRSKHDESIVCAAMSPACDWLVYATPTLMRLFHIIGTAESSGTAATVRKVPCEFGAAYLPQCVTWLGGTDQFAVLSVESVLHVLKADPIHADLLHSIPVEHSNDSGGTVAPQPVTHILVSSDSGRLVAAADEAGGVTIYDLVNKSLYCRLPQYQHPASTLRFDTDNRLLISYIDNKLMEFNVEMRMPTKLSTTLNTLATGDKWFSLCDTIANITCNSECILLQSARLLVMVQKNEKTPRVKSCKNYKYITYGGILHDDYLLVVQNTPDDLLELLPAALQVKSFGD